MNNSEIAHILAELGNETRLEIFRLLIKAEPAGLPIGQIGDTLSLPASTLAFHLKGLVGAKLVSQEKKGRSVLCHADLAALNSVLILLQDECCIDQPSPDMDP